MTDFMQLPLGKGFVGFAALVVIIIGEQIFPAVKMRLTLSRWMKNFGLAVINLAASPFIVVPLSALAAHYAPTWRPLWFGGWLGLGLDLVLLDLWIYGWHRANHEWSFLWRFHSVHHLDETLDASTALRFHFGEVLLSAVIRALVIFLLAIPLSSVLVFETLVLVSTLFHHSNLALPQRLEKLLSLLIITPSLHWVHHHARREDTDSNYGTVFSLWDPLFKSRSTTQRFATMVIGVEGLRDLPLLRLVVKPFLTDSGERS